MNVFENQLGFEQVSAFGVEVDEAVGDVYTGKQTGFDDLRVQCFTFMELVLFCTLQELCKERARLRR